MSVYVGVTEPSTCTLSPASESSLNLAIFPLPLEEVAYPFSSLLMAPPSFEDDGNQITPQDDEFLRDLNMGISTLWDIIASYANSYDKSTHTRSGLSRIRLFRCADERNGEAEANFAVLLSFEPAALSKCVMFQEDISKLNASIHQLLNAGEFDEPSNPPFKITSIAPVDILTDPEPTNPPCMFCLEPLDSTKATYTSVCCHTFHVTCLRLWSQTNTCPVCRFDLMATDFSPPKPPPATFPLTTSSSSTTTVSPVISSLILPPSSPTLPTSIIPPSKIPYLL
mmetsp:Transcript_13758/g.28124  ORF Transcript_13758/g.28124 Transcript_13758/m.28124 type:complete len:282 (+) Transcript_13758:154-999(+)